jgi:uncharacterized protein (UPF0333 family)
MQNKGQSSLEFLLIIIVVLVLIVLIFSSLPKDTDEIVALGITKNHLDNFMLKTNYVGDYNLKATSKENDLNIFVYFTNDYNNELFQKEVKNIVFDINGASGFKNIYIFGN